MQVGLKKNTCEALSASDLKLTLHASFMLCGLLPHLVFTGFIQDFQCLHGNGLIAVVKLGDQELDAPVTKELHTGTQ